MKDANSNFTFTCNFIEEFVTLINLLFLHKQLTFSFEHDYDNESISYDHDIPLSSILSPSLSIDILKTTFIDHFVKVVSRRKTLKYVAMMVLEEEIDEMTVEIARNNGFDDCESQFFSKLEKDLSAISMIADVGTSQIVCLC